jgi:plastocyanin
MGRRRRLIAGFALVGALAVLVFPAAGSALIQQYVVSLTSTGPSPAVVTMPAGYPLVFENTDTVTHSVTFANGSCSVDVAAGSNAHCTGSFGSYAGDYDYTVDGTSQAQIVIQAIDRSVSLRAKRHSIRRGSHLTLHGQLEDAQFPFPCGTGPSQRIIVIAHPYLRHPFHRVAVVRAVRHQPKRGCAALLWHVRIHPRSSMTYIAIASYQPHGGRVWERARSTPFRVNVRRR